MNRPLVSIITPVLNLIQNNRIEAFKECLNSVHEQSYTNIEHIVVDGASEDGTIEMLETYAQKGWIRYISQKDNCLYEAMNTGIDLSSGKYVAILNSDDFFHNLNAVKLSVDALEKSNADFSYADCSIMHNGKYSWTFYGNRDRFIFAMPFSHQTMFTKRQILLDFNKFDLKYSMAADYDFIIRIMLAGCSSIYIPESIATFRSGGISDTSYDKTKKDCAKIFIERYSFFYTFSSYSEAYYLFNNVKSNFSFIKAFYFMAKKQKLTNFDKKLTTIYLLSHVSNRGLLRAFSRLYIETQNDGIKRAVRLELSRNFQRWANLLAKPERQRPPRSKNK